MILSSVTVNSSLLSVELLGMMGTVTLLARFPAVKVTSEDAIAPKSSPSTSISSDSSQVVNFYEESADLLQSHYGLI
jgi:hypothetical protein